MERWFRWIQERDRRSTIALVLFAFLLRWIFSRWVPLSPAWDGVLYVRGAEALSSGLGYTTYMYLQRSSDVLPTAYYPVGYPAFLALFFKVFGPVDSSVHLAGAVTGAVSVGAAHRVAVRIGSSRMAVLAAFLLAIQPGQVLFSSAAMTEPLFGALLTMAVYFAVREEKSPKISSLIATGLLLSAATYVRPQAVLLAPLLGVLRPLASERRWKGRVLAAFLVSAACVLPVVPWSLRNCVSLDACAFVSTNGGSNFALGAVPRATGRYLALTSADGCGGVRGEVRRDRCWRSVAIASIRQDPVRWLRLMHGKLFDTLGYESFPVGYLRESGTVQLTDAQEARWRLWLTRCWLSLLLLVGLALVPFRGRTPLPEAGWVALLSCAGLMLTHAVFFGGDRYHLPLVPLLFAVASAAPRDFFGSKLPTEGEGESSA